jgi:hypothetical protein
MGREKQYHALGCLNREEYGEGEKEKIPRIPPKPQEKKRRPCRGHGYHAEHEGDDRH